MKTLQQWQDKLHAENRIMSEVSVSEAQQIIDCIALEWMQGKAKTLAYPTALQSIGFALKSASERKADHKAIARDFTVVFICLLFNFWFIKYLKIMLSFY